MADPEITENFTKIPNELLEKLAEVDLSDYEHRVILKIIRQTFGYQNAKEDWMLDWISHSQFINTTGIRQKQNVNRTLKSLKERKIIIKKGRRCGINMTYSDWKSSKEITKSSNLNRLQESSKEITEVIQIDDKSNPDRDPQKNKVIQKKVLQNIYIPYDEIIEYLNLKTGKSFRVSSPNTQKLIEARFNEGFTLDDFKKVIDIKTSQWKNTEHDKYLRPKTLFSNKFEDFSNKFEDYFHEKNIKNTFRNPKPADYSERPYDSDTESGPTETVIF